MSDKSMPQEPHWGSGEPSLRRGGGDTSLLRMRRQRDSPVTRVIGMKGLRAQNCGKAQGRTDMVSAGPETLIGWSHAAGKCRLRGT
jgi:hypothetical protein